MPVAAKRCLMLPKITLADGCFGFFFTHSRHSFRGASIAIAGSILIRAQRPDNSQPMLTYDIVKTHIYFVIIRVRMTRTVYAWSWGFN